MEVVHKVDGSLEVNWSRYALDILKKYNMLNCRPIKSPILPDFKLARNEGDLLQDITSYKALVGSLQYLANTIPDLIYCINQVAQFVQEPRTTHLLAAKRILRYIKRDTWAQTNIMQKWQ